MEPTPRPHPASFRDRSGFLFRTPDGELRRRVHTVHEPAYRRMMDDGLYDTLVGRHWLIPHEELPADPEASDHLLDLRPRVLDFVSYPYEWAHGQLREAALLTLRIQREALGRGMTLRDASAYNIQFDGVRPLLIDTLSFGLYEEGRPWVAYRQFCQHFLAPLALMSYRNPRLNDLLRVYIDGIPLRLAADLLPWRCRFRPGLAMHLFLQARLETPSVGGRGARFDETRVSKTGLMGILDSLEGLVEAMTLPGAETRWGDYYESHSYSDPALAAKEAFVKRVLEEVSPALVWDVGANTGRFSRIAAGAGARVVAFDVDEGCVENHFQTLVGEGERAGWILPLRMDLANPSPALGWAHQERDSLADRGPAEAVLALALIHHLCIGNNVPLERVAEWFARLGENLILEFVPREDSQVVELLESREDVFDDYTLERFEAVFSERFTLRARDPLPGMSRVMFHMTRR